ncbi:Uncharacterised protein [Mycobacteroides abscessus subsp. abscessus]|nr:Uncharacterised protein [Mycobacteroides abscessus subsp. abscessus]
MITEDLEEPRMTYYGTIFAGELNHSHTALKWMIVGDIETRIDVIWSSYMLFEELAQAPMYRRLEQIIERNNMFRLGPEPAQLERLLGGQGYHFAVFDPRFKGAHTAAGGTPWHNRDIEARRALFYRRYIRSNDRVAV